MCVSIYLTGCEAGYRTFRLIAGMVGGEVIFEYTCIFTLTFTASIQAMTYNTIRKSQIGVTYNVSILRSAIYGTCDAFLVTRYAKLVFTVLCGNIDITVCCLVGST